jgi:hypothetical protein
VLQAGPTFEAGLQNATIIKGLVFIPLQLKIKNGLPVRAKPLLKFIQHEIFH